MTDWEIDIILCPSCHREAEMRITGTAGDHVPAEIEYWCNEHGMVGFWAYGSWHPDYPINEESL
jgi:hypothetical protein